MCLPSEWFQSSGCCFIKWTFRGTEAPWEVQWGPLPYRFCQSKAINVIYIQLVHVHTGLQCYNYTTNTVYCASDTSTCVLEFGFDFLQLNALHWAAFGGHLSCVKYLAAKLGDKKFDLNMKAESCLHKAVEGGSLTVVRYLIDKCGLDPQLQNGVRDYTETRSCTSSLVTCMEYRNNWFECVYIIICCMVLCGNILRQQCSCLSFLQNDYI